MDICKKDKIKICFNQGLDIRLITEENAFLLSQLSYIGEYIFAFDNIKDEKIIKEKLKIVKKYIDRDWRIKFFVFVSPEHTTLNDDLTRLEWCKDNKVLPYVMRHESCFYDKNKDFYTDLAAYANQPNILKKIDFIPFLDKRHTNKDRIEFSTRTYLENKENI